MRLWDAVEVNPEIGYHGTLYQTEERGFSSRNLFTAQLDVRTRLRRSAARSPSARETCSTCSSPTCSGRRSADDSQDDNPLFTPQTDPLQQRLRELALCSVTRDYADRLDDVNAFTVGFGNRFYVPREDAEGNRLFADVDLALQYDFENERLHRLLHRRLRLARRAPPSPLQPRLRLQRRARCPRRCSP